MTARNLPVGLLAALCASVFLIVGCGGGGGGGGGNKTVSSGSNVDFTGFSFITTFGTESSVAPTENLEATPPKLGAALNLIIAFNFSGVPKGPFNATTLPVYTTPAEVSPEVQVPASQAFILATGTYELVGNAVHFVPAVPSEPLDFSFGASPGAQPGLFPASTYTAVVSDTLGQSIGNLSGPGAQIKFQTTSVSTAYYPAADDAASPGFVAATSSPADGTDDFYPGAFSNTPLGSGQESFPGDGPTFFELDFDKTVNPSEANIQGGDLDGDGIVDPTFFLRSRATRLLVSQTVPADSIALDNEAFPALSSLQIDPLYADPPTDGSNIFLHADTDGTLPDPDPGLTSTPGSIASGQEPSVLFMVLKVEGGNDLLTLADHTAGDPSSALMALDAPAGAPLALDTGLEDLVGLAVLLDGRLVGYDRATRRIYELIPTYDRYRPTPESPVAAAPVLIGLELGDGINGFMSGELSDPGGPADPDVLALAPDTTGELFALARLGGASSPSIIRLNMIDPTASGTFGPEEGLFSGDPADIIATLVDDYADMVFESELVVLALNLTNDTIDRIDLSTLALTTVYSSVGRYSLPLGDLPDGKSPAVSLALGQMDIIGDVKLVSNTADGATVTITTEGLLPIGASLRAMQRNTFASLNGISIANEDVNETASLLGARQLISVRTAVPNAGLGAVIDDVFFEEFESAAYEDPQPLNTSPPAEWAEPVVGSLTTGGLRASTGVVEGQELGDFLPTPDSDFDPTKAYKRGPNPPEPDLNTGPANFNQVLLSTDAQNFPLADGSTPGVISPSTVSGGQFTFRDFIIPEGVHVRVKGGNPLVITATGKVEIHGLLDISGTDGLGDDTFNTGFVHVPGGAGGPGAGRGGHAHPIYMNPNSFQALDQIVTPEEAERGYGPVVTPVGIEFKQIGGHGGLSTLGYDPSPSGLPKLDQFDNREEHRPPGGGGGSFYSIGRQAHLGSGVYLVQSNSTWFPFTKCGPEDFINYHLYGNDENFSVLTILGVVPIGPVTSLQCVYMDGVPEDPNLTKPGGLPGDLVFADGDDTNDFIGAGGELSVLVGGQGGGGGGTRVDSIRANIWATNNMQAPDLTTGFPPYFPKLAAGNIFYSPTRFDAKGGAGGGGGGAIQIRSYGDILISKTGRIDASGGHGGGGEVVRNSNFTGGGGGGSGGAVLLQAAGTITIEADTSHVTAMYTDTDGAEGASVDVSGGFGRDARTNPNNTIDYNALTYDVTRSDGGQGGMGLIQLQVGDGSADPAVEQGAFLFAKQRASLKLGKWTNPEGTQLDNAKQSEHLNGFGPAPDALRYIDMLHYRYFRVDDINRDYYYVLNGSFPPFIPSDGSPNMQGPANEYPAGTGDFWWDTRMIEEPPGSGKYYVQEPEPVKVIQPGTYTGIKGENPAFNPDGLGPDDYDDYWEEIPWQVQNPPGTLYDASAEIPFCVDMVEPDGEPRLIEIDGTEQFDPAFMVDRLPVVSPETSTLSFAAVSHGISRWIDFSGVALRMRDGNGRHPPFFEAFQGTYNTSAGSVPIGKESEVAVSSPIPGIPARAVSLTGFSDPGLFGNGVPSDPPYNDIKVDAPEFSWDDAVTNNALLTVRFQGARPVRLGSKVPDPATLTEWVADLTDLSGYELIRFEVLFDLGVDLDSYPFGVASMRPQVDYVRLRTSY